MHIDEIARIYHAYRRPGFGTMKIDELVEIEQRIAAHRPKSFLEVGTASGLSAAIIAHMLEEHGGELLLTLDASPRFYADTTKEAGFVIPLAYPDGGVTVERRTGWTAVDIVDAGFRFDMALVDAGHAHPWPLIDTLCVNLVLGGSRLLIQDDLTLFRRQGDGRAVGPKFLFDQLPESHREVFTSNAGNVFVMSLDLPREQLEQMAIDAFALPWTLTRRIPEAVVEQFQKVLDENYSHELSEAFARNVRVFNKPHGRYWRQAPTV